MAERGAQPGNQNGRKGRIWSEALKRALARYSGSTVDAGLDRLADKMVKAADEGDKEAYQIIEKIGDRLEGKPAQTLIHNGDEEGGPVQVEGRIKLVRPEGAE
jgi:predicted NBD/HSP70 family sugar kinase